MQKKVVKKTKVTPKKLPAKKLPTTVYDTVIIGGGPAGLMAACQAGGEGRKVLVLEKNEELGKKLLISGGGRCNLTNANPNHRDFVAKYGKKGNFLFTPFSVFGVSETIKFFNDLGLETKVEPGFRVFPTSDNSADVLDALISQARERGVEFKLSAPVSGFKIDKKNKKVLNVILADKTEIKADKFILATGGLSHPETGSTGDGLKWLKDIGHHVVAANPSLVPIKISNPWVSELAGLTLEEVGISLWTSPKPGLESSKRPGLGDQSDLGYHKVLTKRGRLLFTHVGLSGPTILNLSKTIGEYLSYGEVLLAIDFFPGVGLDQMHEMMLQTFTEHANKKIKNLAFPEVPAKIFDLILKQLEIDPAWEVNEIRREERLAIIEKFKKFELTVAGLLGYDQAIISSGGLDLAEVDFKTLGSKLYSNLYLAGDILDFDRPSGGFSLQLCWTTGYIAGKSVR